MSCLKILVVVIIGQCCGHQIYPQKGIDTDLHGIPLVVAYIQGKLPLGQIETKRVIQKRELERGVKPMEEAPAPVVEHVAEMQNSEALPPFFGFQPRPSVNRFPLPRSIEPGLNTNIQTVVPVQPQMAGEMYEGLPPRPVSPVPAEPVAQIVQPPVNPMTVPLPVQETPVTEQVTPRALFDKTKVRKYAVYAGDVILKYLSEFFNRARITYNRFTSPPPPTPVYAK